MCTGRYVVGKWKRNIYATVFLITVYFYLSFVSNSLAYITIPKNKEKQKLTETKDQLYNITSA